MLTEKVMLLPSPLKVGVTLKVGVSGVKVAMFLCCEYFATDTVRNPMPTARLNLSPAC